MDGMLEQWITSAARCLVLSGYVLSPEQGNSIRAAARSARGG